VTAIAELEENRTMEGVYAVARKERLRTRTGSSYLVLELVDTVGQVHPLLPDRFVAVGDLSQRAIDGGPAVAEQAPSEADVADLDG